MIVIVTGDVGDPVKKNVIDPEDGSGAPCPDFEGGNPSAGDESVGGRRQEKRPDHGIG